MNFCHPAFHTRIYSDRVSRDNYEPSNLVDGSREGFLVESFIRTPVNITLEFPCNVDLQKVIVHGEVGSQRTAAVEVYTCCEVRNPTSLDVSTLGYTMKKRDDLIFMFTGKLNNNQPVYTYQFENHSFRARRQLCGQQIMPHHHTSTEPLRQPIRHREHRYVSNVSHVTLRITRTFPGCVAGIKWLEVWGQPSSQTKPHIASAVFKIFQSVVNPPPSSVSVHTRSAVNKTNVSAAPEQHAVEPVRSKVNIPQEFIDPITLEMMSLPVVLPSGHTVDQSTLDRHTQEESRWGRLPNDPFTGVMFSSDSKPLPSTALKVRLDMFLLQHGQDVETFGRTLGRGKSGSQNDSVSSIVRKSTSVMDGATSHLIKETDDSSRTSFSPAQDVSSSLNSLDHKNRNLKRSLICSNDGEKHKQIKLEIDHGKHGSAVVGNHTINSDFAMHDETSEKLQINRNSNSKPSSTVKDAINLPYKVVDKKSVHEHKCHTGKLTDSLDDALNNTLMKLPSFSKPVGVNSLSGGKKPAPLTKRLTCLSQTKDRNDMSDIDGVLSKLPSYIKSKSTKSLLHQDKVTHSGTLTQLPISADSRSNNKSRQEYTEMKREISLVPKSSVTYSGKSEGNRSAVLSRNETKPSHFCSYCRKSLQPNEMYVMPCEHYSCRNCLLQQGAGDSILCGTCHVTHLRKNVSKAHG